MKKIICILFALLVLTLCACAKKEEQGDALEPLPAVDGPVNAGADLADSPFVGLFKNSYSSLYKSAAKDVYPEPSCAVPELHCESDGTFTFMAVSAVDAESYVMTGTFTVEGDTATFSIERHETSGYLGDDAGSFTMTLIDTDEMRYAGGQIASVSAGDIFARAQAAS
ncbi:MAG: hypothetical protein VB092_01460 [Oscillospiraceae bacterium]|nr:hypothetical protein [Oscillospiraceae bacterium]